MNDAGGFDGSLRTISNALFWSFGMCMILLALWYGMLVLAHELVYDLHSQLFEMTLNQFDLLHCILMGALKIGALVFFLFPALAIRLTLRTRKRGPTSTH